MMGGATSTQYQVDWERADQEAALDPRIYQTDTSYDALNRIKRVTFPEDVSNDRKVLVPFYGRNNVLERIDIIEQNETVDRPVVVYIAYNARGQRSLIAYGNGLMTRYAYDPGNFMVSRVRTERYVQGGAFDFIPTGGLLQDLGYDRDLVGNITRIRERSPGSGVPDTALGTDAINREFRYDPLYRLISAAGREHSSRNPSSDPWLDEMFPIGQDSARARTYTREYEYDAADNLTRCRHLVADNAGSFNRSFTHKSDSNHLISSTQGALVTPFSYDPNGNLTRQETSRRFEWNHCDRLVRFRIQAGEATPSIDACYAYDASGQRVKKIVRKQDGSVSSITYVGNSFEHLREGEAENNLVLVQDVLARVAQLRVGPAFPGDQGPAIQYLLPDQIQNTDVVVDQTGAFIRREEFYPYGGTSFGSFARKRYRFTGKERDEESGLSYHRARYYAPVLARWISPDPGGTIDGLNLYKYGRNNPIRFYDTSGNEATDGITWIGSTNYHPWQTAMIPDSASSSNRFWRVLSWAGEHLWSGAKWVANKDRQFGKYQWSNTMQALQLMWGKSKNIAGNIWNWSKDHKLLAGGIAIGVAVVSFLTRKSLWNWLLAPAIRIASNAAFGYAMFGSWAALGGAVFGAAHGFAMAKAGTYNWKSGWGWVAFISDNTWSLANSFVGSVFAGVNVPWNEIDEAESQNSNSLYFKTRWIGYDTTLGNVTIGTPAKYGANSVPQHEATHAWQARVLGPLFYPAIAVAFEVATVLPYWFLYGHCSVGANFTYFTKGVYPNTFHELHAYSVQGDAC